MTIENDPSARMQFVGMGELTHPGSCMVCGSGNCERGYVRLGVYFEYEGEMYLCLNCVVEASELIGCLTPEESDLIRAQGEQAVAFATEATELLEKANERLTAYDTVLAGIDPVLYGNGAGPSIPASEESASADVTSGTPVEVPAVNEPESPEPVKKPRRGNPAKSPEPDRSNEITI